ncbi:hypothetical protein [Nocardia sp. NPDC058666]|uniref:hypothetical protein n=1 Tax=Nocardia sp. NPDC058666 TaxID=3346587 RepID=UPI0036593F6F
MRTKIVLASLFAAFLAIFGIAEAAAPAQAMSINCYPTANAPVGMTVLCIVVHDANSVEHFFA